MAEPETPAPIVAVTDTPEFKAAIAEATKQALAMAREELLAEMKTAVASAAPAEEQGSMSLMRQMALAIAEISDQGTNRKRVAPEILAARATATARMGELVIRARESKDVKPEYRLISKVYIGEQLVDPFRKEAGPGGKMVPQEIIWDGPPNEAMRPINDMAKAIYEQFLASIGGLQGASGVAQQPVWVTPRGVVIKGAGTTTAQVHGQTVDNSRADTFEVKTQNDPTAPFINVLGSTPAGRARQNFAVGQ